MRRIQRRAWLAPIAAAVLCAAAGPGARDQAEAAIDEAKTFAPGAGYQYIVMGLLVALLVGMIVWVVYAYRRMADGRLREQQAEIELEAQVGSILAERRGRLRGENRPAPSAPDAGAGQPPASAIAPAVVGAAGAPESAPAEPAGGSIDDVLAKLRASGLFAAVEGMLYLSDGRTEARIVRLTNGKAALVMPRLEAPAFLARHLRRFDLCIVPLEGDSIGVLAPFGAYVADHFSM
jgi:hypothetical protein